MSCRRNCGYVAILLVTMIGTTTAADDVGTVSLTPPLAETSTEPAPQPTTGLQSKSWPQAWNETGVSGRGLGFDRPSRTNAIMGRTMVVTAVLATACLFVVVWNRRRETVQRKPNSAELHLLGTLTLAPRCYLQLVSINEQQFLVARDASVVRSVTSVGNFQAAYDSLSDSSEPALGDSVPAPVIPPTERRPLSTAFQHDAQPLSSSRSVGSSSSAGISLESHSHSESRLSDLESSIRRSDPWQGSRPNHR